MSKKILHAGVLAVALMLTSCGGNPTDPSSSQRPSSSEDKPVVGNLASGSFDLSTMPWQEKSKIVAALESYAMTNHSAGIPLYDDASFEQFSKRVKLPSTHYLTNYGFGVGYGSISGDEMYNGPLLESNAKWRSYFHGYTNTDSGTFNGWDATGADVSDRMSMISSSYFGVKANDDNTDYYWVGSLATQNEPIMLDEDGNVVDLSGLSDDEREAKTSQFWRVPLHFGEGYSYRYVGKTDLQTKYDGRDIALEDYLTPFKMMLNHQLVRYSNLVSDADGLQGAMEYVYDKSKQELAKDDWTKSGVGVQLSPDGDGLDFAFIQPKSITYARTNLSSQLYSPVPESFIDDIGGISNYGKIGTGSPDSSSIFDNILCFGAYVPEYWEQGKEIVFKKNETYYEADDFHYDGYTEVVFSGEKSDELAYKAFLNNELDEVTIPSNYIDAHKNDPQVYRTEGSTIIKLNINSCTQEEWDYYFGPNGNTHPHNEKEAWPVKPIMSNEDFLNGMYFAINRKLYADKAGRNPAMGYLSNAYMLDPAGKTSYRSSEAGKAVLARYDQAAGEGNYGYNAAYAQTLFKNAAKQLVEAGYYDEDETIEITGLYRYQTTIDNIGKYVAQDIEESFNKGAAEAGYPSLKLDINLEVGGSSYTDTYTRMDHGEFDFAEGAISGNVLNPLSFMNTMSTTKALHQGFNLNWGHRTDLVQKNPCHYEFVEDGVTRGGNWSFDALYNASQGFTVVDEGVTTPIASNETFMESKDGTTIIWRAEFPANATDEDGNSLFNFSLSDFAVLTSDSGTPNDGMYVSNARISQDNNGYITIRVKKDDIINTAASVASRSGKTQKVFEFWFTLVYSIKLPSGTITKATQVITAPQQFSNFKIDPVKP